MDTWIDRLATSLGEEPLAPTEVEALLDAAREIAHGIERKVTPLTTFMMGIAVGRDRGREPREVSLARALETVRRMIEEEGRGPKA